MRRLQSTEALSERNWSFATARKVIETWFLFRIRHDGQSPPSIPQPFLKSERHRQLIFSVFKTLTDQTVIVELKNDLLITGVLKSVDQSVSLIFASLPQQPVSLSGLLTARVIAV